MTPRVRTTVRVSRTSNPWTGVGDLNGSRAGSVGDKHSYINQLAHFQQLDVGLRLWVVMRSAAFVLAAALLITPGVHAESVSAPMNVSAQVLARAVVTVDSMPEVEITAADIARGYVDLAQPVQFRVRTNSRSGCLLQVAKTDETFAAVELAFGNTSMTVGQESWIARPYVAGGESVTASVRIRLAPGASLGRHALPLAFSASAL